MERLLCILTAQFLGSATVEQWVRETSGEATVVRPLCRLISERV